MRWNYLSIAKLQWCKRWFHPTHHNRCNQSQSMLVKGDTDNLRMVAMVLTYFFGNGLVSAKEDLSFYLFIYLLISICAQQVININKLWYLQARIWTNTDNRDGFERVGGGREREFRYLIHSHCLINNLPDWHIKCIKNLYSYFCILTRITRWHSQSICYALQLDSPIIR